MIWIKIAEETWWNYNWASAWDFQQFDILTGVDLDEPLQPPFKLRISKWCSVSSLTIIEYSSDEQWLWSDCANAQAGLRPCWSHTPHCWKSCVVAQLFFRCSRAANSVVSHGIWPKFKLINAFMYRYVLVTYKNEEDQIKNERARVVKTL